MGKLIILQAGQTVAEVHLEAGHSYKVGRGSACDIVLPTDRGVSREHAIIEQDNGLWTIRLLSKYGEILINGAPVQSAVLQGDMHLTVPPFEFHFEEQAAAAIHDNFSADENAIHNHEPSKLSLTALPTQRIATDHEQTPPAEPVTAGETPDFADATQVASIQSLPYLTIRNSKVHTEEVLKLEGQHWRCGRQNTNEISINDKAISRLHFEILVQDSKYYVKDCGSSNGTRVNGDKITPDTLTEIQSGDVLQVRHIEILFEVRNPNIEKMLQILPQNTEQPGYSPAVIRLEPELNSPKSLMKKIFANKVRTGIAAAVVVGLFVALSDNQDSGEKTNPSESESEQPISSLSDEQRTRVRDAFNLAKNHYNMQKFELCLAQLETVHEITPLFENSKELETLCRQGRETQQYVLDQQRREQQRMEVLNRIRAVVNECRTKVTPATTTSEIDLCLQEASELDPQNELVITLRTEVESNEIARQAKKQSAADFARRRNEGRAMFENAQRTEKTGNLKSALQLYRKFLSQGYPGLNREEDEARRNVASINKNIENEINEQLKVCESALQSTQLKNAYISCSKVLREHPGNTKALEMRNEAMKQMNKQMKDLYDNAVVEESYGSIESAKQKWQEIINNSVPQNDFHSKAKSKLKKYGL